MIDAEQFGVIALQGKSEEFIDGVMFMFDKIHEAPTVEPKPCKTCNYWNGELTYCMKWSAFMDADDFCSEHLEEGDEK